MSKQNSESFVSKGLNLVDLFERPISLNMEGNSSLKSAFGGLLSILVILGLLSQAAIQFVNITERKNPSVVQMDEYDYTPSRISLSIPNNFMFAITTSLSDKTINMSNNSLISIQATFRQQYRSKDGSILKRKNNILWAPCSSDQFPKDVVSEEDFSTYALQYAYCPTGIDFNDATYGCPDDIKAKYPDCKTPLDVGIQGSFLSLIFEFIQIQIKICDSNSISTTQGLKCSTESISDIFNSAEIKANFYFLNNIIDPVNYKTPSKAFLDTIFWYLSPSKSQVADIFVDTATMQDYDDYIDTNAYQNRTFYTISTDKVRELQSFKQNTMVEFNLRRSNLNSVTIRKYLKISDVISNIGGLSKIFLVVGAFLSIGYVRYKSQMALSNKLYNFDLPDTKKTKRIDITASNNHRDLTQGNVVSSLLRLKTKVTTPAKKLDNPVKNYFDAQLEESKKLKYGEFQYFKSLLNSLCCRRSVEDKLSEIAQKQVIKDLDVVKIVEKLKEIDKLKHLLLNRHQRKAFDYIEKPIISLEGKKPKHKKNYKKEDKSKIYKKEEDENKEKEKEDQPEGVFEVREEYNSLSEYSKLYLAYNQLKQDSDPRSWKYNKKLINMMGEHLREVFEKVDKTMEGTPDARKFEEVVQKMIEGKNVLDNLLNQKTEDNLA